MRSARKFVEISVREKRDHVARLAARYLALAFSLHERSVLPVAASALDPFFALDDGTLSVLEMGLVSGCQRDRHGQSSGTGAAFDSQDRRKLGKQLKGNAHGADASAHAVPVGVLPVYAPMKTRLGTGRPPPAEAETPPQTNNGPDPNGEAEALPQPRSEAASGGNTEAGPAGVASAEIDSAGSAVIKAGAGGRVEAEVKAGGAGSAVDADHAEHLTCRYYFDQETTSDKDSAYVEFASAKPGELLVVCPTGAHGMPHAHLRRRRYLRVLGTAISEHMAAAETFVVRFAPPQLNGIVSLGCLGFYIVPQQSRKPGSVSPESEEWQLADTAEFRVNREWPSLACGEARAGDAGGGQSAQLASPVSERSSAVHRQFQTVWRDGAFLSSYYNMISGQFAWAWRDSPFRTEVATLKRSGRLVLGSVNWTVLEKLPAGTELYCEYMPCAKGGNDRETACLFGTIGDVLSKRSLFQPDDPGLQLLSLMRVYYIDPAKPVALAHDLNRRRGAGPEIPALDPNTALQGLPGQALNNFANIWKRGTVQILRRRMLADKDFADSAIHSVPEDVRHIVRPAQGLGASADDMLLAVAKVISLYPSRFLAVLQEASEDSP